MKKFRAKIICLVWGHRWWNQASKYLRLHGATYLPQYFNCERCGELVDVQKHTRSS